MIKIMIVDDHEIFRNGLRMVINNFDHSNVIAEAANGIEFLEKMKTNKPDVVFMDIKMPQMNGIEASQKALELYPDLKIIALSMFGEEKFLQELLEIGVYGFLLKNIDKNKLYKAIEAVSAGHNYFSEELLMFFTNKYLKDKKKENQVVLTKREMEVLELISEGLTDKEIGEKLFISERTVNGHRANLIAKTGSKNTVNLLIYAIKNKLIDI